MMTTPRLTEPDNPTPKIPVPMKKTMRIKLEDIVCNAGTQMRVATPKQRAREFAECMTAGDKFPPLKVVHDGKKHYLVDGFTRFEGWRLVPGTTDVDCEVISGTRKDAIRLALCANAEHDTSGLPRTSDDKRKAVRRAEKEFPDRSVRELANLCKVGKSLVAAMRTGVPSGGRVATVRADTETASKAEEIDADAASDFGGAPWVSLDEPLGGDLTPVFGEPPGSEKIVAAAALESGIARDWPELAERLQEHVKAVNARVQEYQGVLVRLSQLLLDNGALAESDQVALNDIKSRIAQIGEIIATIDSPVITVTAVGSL